MRQQSVVNLDPIDVQRSRQDSVLSRFFKTRHFKGKGGSYSEPYGHYLFCGRQGAGKTVSMIWYYELLRDKYTKKGFDVVLYSNFHLKGCVYIKKSSFLKSIQAVEYDSSKVHIFLIDEIQSWYPKDTRDKFLLKEIDDLTGEFSQLRKRNIYVLSTAQVYGRVNKNLREQCLYMIDNRRSRLTRRYVSDFIDGDDILCDTLGRWSGIPSKICVHGLPKLAFDTHERVSNSL